MLPNLTAIEKAAMATKKTGFLYLTVSADAGAKYLTRAPSRCNEASLCISSGNTAACAQSEYTVWKKRGQRINCIVFPCNFTSNLETSQKSAAAGSRQTKTPTKEDGAHGFGLQKESNIHKNEAD